MTLTANIQQIEISRAIAGMVELAFPRDNENNDDKVLLVPLRFDVSESGSDGNFGCQVTIVAFKPYNYCFVGMVEGTPSMLENNQNIHFESYHDSCWRDGIGRMIKDVTSKILDKIEASDADENNVHVFNSFGFGAPKVIKGGIRMDSTERTASFVTLKD